MRRCKILNCPSELGFEFSCPQLTRSKLCTLTSSLWGHQGRRSSQPMISGTGHFLHWKGLWVLTKECPLSMYAFVEYCLWLILILPGMPSWSLAAQRSARLPGGGLPPPSSRARSWLLTLLERWEMTTFIAKADANVFQASKNKPQKGKSEDKAPSRLNPTRFPFWNFTQLYLDCFTNDLLLHYWTMNFYSLRLFICGLAPGVSKTNLKEMFPKVRVFRIKTEIYHSFDNPYLNLG